MTGSTPHVTAQTANARRRWLALTACALLTACSSPLPEVFEVSWQTPDGQWRRARVPVRSRLHHRVEGHSLLFWLTGDTVRGEYITYTLRGDQAEVFTEAAAEATDEATARAVSPR